MLEQRARFRRAARPVDLRRQPRRRGRRRVRARACRGSASGPRQNFDFAGYVTGFDPAAYERPERASRARLGLPTGRAAVRGHGRRLRRRGAAAAPGARRGAAGPAAGARSCGSWSSPARGSTRPSLPRRPGRRRCVGYLPDLTEHLAACDVAVVQGGLDHVHGADRRRQRRSSTCPLRHHFEQNFHVRHRLERYGAGPAWTTRRPCDPDALAAAVVEPSSRARWPTARCRDRRRGAGPPRLLAELL